MDIITQFLEKVAAKKPRILVVGDCMVDEYYKVKVSRISPESPNVSVMQTEGSQPEVVRPGGAANVAAQFRALGVECDYAGFVDQEAGWVLFDANVKMLTLTIPYPVPRKRRYFDGDTQVGNRWDIERPDYGMDAVLLHEKRLELATMIKDRIADYDAVILSDYDKGLFGGDAQVFLSACRGKPTIVDPKKGPLIRWNGCTYIKPNSEEAANLTGTPDPYDQARRIWNETCCEGVIITRGANGVLFYDDEREYDDFVPAGRVTANSVIGAGDSFAAVFAAAIACGMPMREAGRVAYHAGSLYVQGRHNTPVSRAQLQTQTKFVTPEYLARRNVTLVFTNGCFDILHAGHLETLRFARAQGERLVVAVNSDASVARLKGPTRPVNPLADRMKLLAALECVDFVVSFDEDDPLNLIKTIKPDVLVKGGDYVLDKIVGYSEVPRVCLAPLVEDRSTTSLIRKLAP